MTTTSATAKARILFLTRFSIAGLLGAQTRVIAFLQHLAQENYSIECAILGRKAGEGKSAPANLHFVYKDPPAPPSLRGLMKKVYHALPPRLKGWLSPLKKLAGAGSTFLGPLNDAEKQFFLQRVHAFRPHVVVTDYAWLANAFDVLPKAQPLLKVILTHEVLHLIVEDLRKIGLASDHLDWTREEEAKFLTRADFLLSSAEEDAQVFAGMMPDPSRVLHMPIGLPSQFHDKALQVARRCLFVGSNTNFTVDCLKWFLEAIWPGVSRLAPGATLHACGSCGPELLRTHPRLHIPPGVVLQGWTEDLGREYAEAAVCVAPITYPRGVKIKLMEALSHGKACVATEMGMDGARSLRDKAILVAPDAESFASAVARVLNDAQLRQGLERGARDFATHSLSPARAHRPFVETVESFMAQQASPANLAGAA